MKRSPARPTLWGVVAALLIVAVGIAGFAIVRDLDRSRSRGRALDRLLAATAAFGGSVDEAIVQAERRGRSHSAASAASDVALIERLGDRYVASSETALFEDGFFLAGLPSLRETALYARDSAATEIFSTRIAGRAAAVAIVPLFGGSDPPVATAERRRALSGFLIADLDIDRIAERTFASLPLGVTVSDGSLVLYQSDEALSGSGDELARTRTKHRGRRLTVSAFGAQPGAGVASWLALSLALALGAGVIAAAVRRARRTMLAERAIADQKTAQALVGDVAAQLQETLDLSELLPEAAMLIADRLELDAIRVAAATSDGMMRDVFAFGAGRDSVPGVRYPLMRGGRQIGSMVVHPRGPIGEEREHALHAVAGLLASAMANAAALEAERNTNERLSELDKLKTDFLATVSHELRTPLVSIIGFSQVLNRSWDSVAPDDARDYVERIERNAAALSRMLQQVLDFSRLERQKVRPMLRDVDLAGVVRDLIERDSTLTGKRIDVDGPDLLPARSDVDAIERIVGNLLSNAAKFSPPDGTIRLSIGVEGPDVVIVVDDEGPGVAPEDRERIFVRFYRGSGEPALRARGAGIGLAVVAELVDALRGTVTVHEAPQGGARFVVRLPRFPINDTDASSVSTEAISNGY